jgi:hypothetical protein
VQYCQVEKKGKSFFVVRLSDSKILGKGFDRKHAKTVANKMNAWYNLGWPYQIED